MPSHAIGIDLGTTYSCVAVVLHGKAEVLANDQGNRTTPSQVAFSSSERLIGEAAKNQAALNAKNTIFDAKRLIGRNFDDPTVLNCLKHWPFKVVESENNRLKVEVEVKQESETFFPEEISSMVLSKMKETAENFLGATVKDAVITVPAYFTDAQRQATKDAGEIAGLNVLRIINEPTAAALAFSLDKAYVPGHPKNVLIYDFGGGTFDVTILEITGKELNVKATAGDNHLGGGDLDSRMVDHFIKEFKNKHRKDLSGDAQAVFRLREACEQAKRTLSTLCKANINISSLYDGIDFTTSIRRAAFEELCADLLNGTMSSVRKALDDAHLSKTEIDEVVLVGGSTRIPKIVDMIGKFFPGRKIAKNINPDEAVALGAAILAGQLTGDPADNMYDRILNDVTPFSLGIEVKGEKMETLIKRNSNIPVKVTKSFTTVYDNQTAVCIKIYEGEHLRPGKNDLLGDFVLGWIAPAKKGKPKIDVSFELNENGILKVHAVDTKNGNCQGITITNSRNRLSPEEIDHMIRQAGKYGKQDTMQRQTIAAENHLQEYCNEMRKKMTLDPVGAKLAKKDKARILAKCDGAILWLNQNKHDKDEIEDATDELKILCASIMNRLHI